MRRSSVQSNSKGKVRTILKSASVPLIEYANKIYSKAIPISAIIGACKTYGKEPKILQKDSKLIKRLAGADKEIPIQKFTEYISSTQNYEKGQKLSEETIKRIYKDFANEQGKLSFEYIMKMGDTTGVKIDAKTAKAIVRRYGKKKDHINVEDCIRINERRHQKSSSKSPKKE